MAHGGQVPHVEFIPAGVNDHSAHIDDVGTLPSELYDLISRPDWWWAGKCRPMPLELFFPHNTAGVIVAKQICRSCPVRTECGDYGIAGGERLKGVWGGLSERDRRNIRKHAA